MLRPTWPIATDRLLLRPFTPADVDDVWDYQRRPEVARHMAWEPRDREQTRDAVGQMTRETALMAEGDCLSLAVVQPDLGQVVGQVELIWRSREHQQGEIGYVFNPEHQGRGYATEAARELLSLGFDGLCLHRIVGRCWAQNTASARLLARLGMRREGHHLGAARSKGGWRDELVYAMLRREWRG